MAWRDSNRVSLSKSILEMKFMKRTKEKVDKQAYQQEGEEYFGNQGVPKKTGRFITEASYAFCEDLIEGRLSFQGENPELERLLELEEMEKNAPKENENETDVSDAQMAQAWKSRSLTKINVKNINIKSDRRDKEADEEPSRKRPKFLKPADD